MKNKFTYIPENEYSEKFDVIRRAMMQMSFYKYGPAKLNYPDNSDAIAALEQRLELYKITGNKEHLTDVANFAMLEFMYPKHPNAHYEPTDSDKSPGLVGFGVGELEDIELVYPPGTGE